MLQRVKVMNPEGQLILQFGFSASQVLEVQGRSYKSEEPDSVVRVNFSHDPLGIF